MNLRSINRQHKVASSNSVVAMLNFVFRMRAATGRWTRLVVPDSFGDVSSHTVTAVAPGVVIVFGGEDGPRTTVKPEVSVWKYEKGSFASVKQDMAQAMTVLGHTAFGHHGKLYVCKCL